LSASRGRDRGGAVFQIVILPRGSVGQLPFFRTGHKAGLEFDGGGGGEMKPRASMPTIASTMPGLKLAVSKINAAGKEAAHRRAAE